MANHTLPDFDSLSVSLKVDKKDLEQKYQNRVDNWASFFDKVFISIIKKYIDIVTRPLIISL